jgi:parallel beta-helix repeat protein
MKKLIALGVVMLMLLLAGCTAPEENGEEPIVENALYVAPYGDDTNIGSIDSPWETIQHAWISAEAGDTVYVREGIYKEKIRAYKKGSSGNETHWIKYKAYPDEKVVIEEDEHGYWRGTWQLTQQSYIQIDGFWFVNGSCFGIMLIEDGGTISNVWISNCHFNNYSESMIKAKGIEDLLIENCTGDEICNSWYTLAGQEGISISSCERAIVRRNEITNCYKQCIDIKSGSSNCEVYENTIDNSFGYNPNDTRKWLGGGIYVDSYSLFCDKIYIYRNIIFGDKTGITLGAEKGGETSFIHIYDNRIATSGIGMAVNQKGYDLPTTKIHDIYVHDNTFIGNSIWFVNKMPIGKAWNFFFERNTIL